MNAYELALHLQVESSQAEYGYVVDDWKLLDDSANMLRQQADRIHELSNWKINAIQRIAELENEKIRAYDNGFEDAKRLQEKAKNEFRNHPSSKCEVE